MNTFSWYLRTVLLGCAALLVSAIAGCESPLVGLTCKAGFVRCGGACFDLSVDRQNCGACGTACFPSEVCSEAMCVVPDGGLPGASDGGVPGDPLCTEADAATECTCGIGQLKCGGSCVEAGSDPNNCGECGTVCEATGICIYGTCAPNCDPPLTLCSTACRDLSRDFYSCGACDNVCPSGLCVDGRCLGKTVGHVIVIGHDMSSARIATRRVAANALFMSSADPVRIVLYDERSSDSVKAGVNAALLDAATNSGRSYEVKTAKALSVPFRLGDADVFVIEAQTNAKDSALIKNGKTWAAALRSFVGRGGVVVLFDGGGSNAGTYQTLQAAGMFSARSRTTLTGKRLSLVTPGDAVASFVPNIYQGDSVTVGFDSDEQTVVVKEPDSDLPVVIHLIK